MANDLRDIVEQQNAKIDRRNVKFDIRLLQQTDEALDKIYEKLSGIKEAAKIRLRPKEVIDKDVKEVERLEQKLKSSYKSLKKATAEQNAEARKLHKETTRRIEEQLKITRKKIEEDARAWGLAEKQFLKNSSGKERIAYYESMIESAKKVAEAERGLLIDSEKKKYEKLQWFMHKKDAYIQKEVANGRKRADVEGELTDQFMKHTEARIAAHREIIATSESVQKALKKAVKDTEKIVDTSEKLKEKIQGIKDKIEEWKDIVGPVALGTASLGFFANSLRNIDKASEFTAISLSNMPIDTVSERFKKASVAINDTDGSVVKFGKNLRNIVGAQVEFADETWKAVKLQGQLRDAVLTTGRSLDELTEISREVAGTFRLTLNEGDKIAKLTENSAMLARTLKMDVSEAIGFMAQATKRLGGSTDKGVQALTGMAMAANSLHHEFKDLRMSTNDYSKIVLNAVESDVRSSQNIRIKNQLIREQIKLALRRGETEQAAAEEAAERVKIETEGSEFVNNLAGMDLARKLRSDVMKAKSEEEYQQKRKEIIARWTSDITDVEERKKAEIRAAEIVDNVREGNYRNMYTLGKDVIDELGSRQMGMDAKTHARNVYYHKDLGILTELLMRKEGYTNRKLARQEAMRIKQEVESERYLTTLLGNKRAAQEFYGRLKVEAVQKEGETELEYNHRAYAFQKKMTELGMSQKKAAELWLAHQKTSMMGTEQSLGNVKSINKFLLDVRAHSEAIAKSSGIGSILDTMKSLLNDPVVSAGLGLATGVGAIITGIRLFNKIGGVTAGDRLIVSAIQGQDLTKVHQQGIGSRLLGKMGPDHPLTRYQNTRGLKGVAGRAYGRGIGAAAGGIRAVGGMAGMYGMGRYASLVASGKINFKKDAVGSTVETVRGVASALSMIPGPAGDIARAFTVGAALGDALNEVFKQLGWTGEDTIDWLLNAMDKGDKKAARLSSDAALEVVSASKRGVFGDKFKNIGVEDSNTATKAYQSAIESGRTREQALKAAHGALNPDKIPVGMRTITRAKPMGEDEKAALQNYLEKNPNAPKFRGGKVRSLDELNKKAAAEVKRKIESASVAPMISSPGAVGVPGSSARGTTTASAGTFRAQYQGTTGGRAKFTMYLDNPDAMYADSKNQAAKYNVS